LSGLSIGNITLTPGAPSLRADAFDAREIFRISLRQKRCTSGAQAFSLLVGTAVSQSGGRSRNRQQDECQEELRIVLPPTNSDNSMILRARSSSDVRIFINDTVSFYLWQAKAGFSRERFESLGTGIPAAGFATKLGRRIQLEAGSE
jgi:hypothetical protein